MNNLITDLPGILVGQAHDSQVATGVSAVIFDEPAIASIAVHGGAPGLRDAALLEPEMSVPGVDAFVLSGGSVFGLDAMGGVIARLAEAGRGFAVRDCRLPIAPGAILFDMLNGGDKAWGRRPPYWELGYEAASNAARDFALGTAGAGYGATTFDLKGGIGSASAISSRGFLVGALVAVNAVGRATRGSGPHFWAAPYERGKEFGGLGTADKPPADALEMKLKGDAPNKAFSSEVDTGSREQSASKQKTGGLFGFDKSGNGSSTTLAIVAADAPFSKAQMQRVAIMAQDGIAFAVRPAHAPMDGDTVFAATTSRSATQPDLRDLTEIGLLAAECVARAIARAIFEATPLDNKIAPPSWRKHYGW